MGSPNGSKFMKKQVSARGSSPLTVSEGPVMLAYGATEARLTGFLRDIDGNFQGVPRIRKFAVRPDEPEPWVDGTALSPDGTTGNFKHDFSLASFGDFMFLQLGIGGEVSAGSAGEALLGYQAWTDAEARIVARQRVVVNQDVNATKSGIIPLGKPFPVMGLSGIMIGIQARGVTATQNVNFVNREFEGDPSLPGNWSSNMLGSDKAFSAGNEDYNSGDLTSWTDPDAALGQIGLVVDGTTSGSNGVYDVIVAARFN